ncbi:hypothetical protein CTAYLR_003672 [Chrysophaeum taylorii]|uniref:Fe2OG dioxygenase domain-containing protein n=1 Tax=Chrysophaeum taylorii TaxID=2483200 RepID=A0AAD7UED8_9STRA|nr:hypothetical protein CTAYLR_003672 [Chrysophaeum taylorii]
MSRREVCNGVSAALQEKRWGEAASRLAELSRLGGVAKVGALQRWVRDADAARHEDEVASFALLWLLCRVAAGEPAAVPREPVAVVRFDPWEPCERRPNLGGGPAERSASVSSFFVAHTEKALERQPPNRYDLRIWTSREVRTLAPATARRVEVGAVEGAFVLNGVLSVGECRELLDIATQLGFEPDEPLDPDQRDRLALAAARTKGAFAALADDDDDLDDPEPRTNLKTGVSERSKTVVWLADAALNEGLFERCRSHLPQTYDDCRDARGRAVGRAELCGLNARWRLYRYDAGGTYRPHVDGAWPASALDSAGNYVYDAFGDRLSKLTAVVYLNDDFSGGTTAFYSAADDNTLRVFGVTPRAGSVLFFPHGDAAGSLIHEGSNVASGSKYIIRTEVLYKWGSSSSSSSYPSSRNHGRARTSTTPFVALEHPSSGARRHDEDSLRDNNKRPSATTMTATSSKKKRSRRQLKRPPSSIIDKPRPRVI